MSELLFEKRDGLIKMRETRIDWISEGIGFLDEGNGKDYTIFAIRFEDGAYKLYLTGSNWKKTCKPISRNSLWQARRLAEGIALELESIRGSRLNISALQKKVSDLLS